MRFAERLEGFTSLGFRAVPAAELVGQHVDLRAPRALFFRDLPVGVANAMAAVVLVRGAESMRILGAVTGTLERFGSMACLEDLSGIVGELFEALGVIRRHLDESEAELKRAGEAVDAATPEVH